MLDRMAVLTLVLAAGCTFRVPAFTQGAFDAVDLSGVDGPEPGVDLSVADAGQDDLQTADALSMSDLAAPPDLSGPDQTPSIGFPSHVGYHFLDDSTTDWTIGADTRIDTTQASAAAAITPPPPPGVVYAIEGGLAVLAVHSLTVGSGAGSTVRLSVVGVRPLAIVAGDRIQVNGTIDAGAHGSIPGPGGNISGTGPGPGTSGAGAASNGSGGSGGGHGTPGGAGGGALKPNGTTALGPAGGVAYGLATLDNLLGGSGGGSGNLASGTTLGCSSPASGGGGGGALQLSARQEVQVTSFHLGFGGFGGIIQVGGGGGRGGCGGSTRSGSGGGGGSGGALLIEAPKVQVDGVLGASGGGGGGGGTHVNGGAGGFNFSGGAGADGLNVGNLAASSFGGFGSGNNSGGGGGANAITRMADADSGSTSTDRDSSGGGGGGGYGRIYLRSSGAATVGTSSPAPTTDPSLPGTIP